MALFKRFGNYKTGWLFYEKEIDYVKASNEVYFEKMLVDEMHRKSVCQAVFNHWVLSELQERKLVGNYFLGPYYYENNGSRKLLS
jgi:hypothetical protein